LKIQEKFSGDGVQPPTQTPPPVGRVHPFPDPPNRSACFFGLLAHWI